MELGAWGCKSARIIGHRTSALCARLSALILLPETIILQLASGIWNLEPNPENLPALH
jgi:hypothetical protein